MALINSTVKREKSIKVVLNDCSHRTVNIFHLHPTPCNKKPQQRKTAEIDI